MVVNGLKPLNKINLSIIITESCFTLCPCISRICDLEQNLKKNLNGYEYSICF